MPISFTLFYNLHNLFDKPYVREPLAAILPENISSNEFVRMTEKPMIVIVFGLSRSGTSMMMMMMMLAGGLQVVTDHISKSDEDNPKGYYEFEKVKKIKEDASRLEDCHGKVIKVISQWKTLLKKQDQ